MRRKTWTYHAEHWPCPRMYQRTAKWRRNEHNLEKVWLCLSSIPVGMQKQWNSTSQNCGWKYHVASKGKGKGNETKLVRICQQHPRYLLRWCQLQKTITTHNTAASRNGDMLRAYPSFVSNQITFLHLLPILTTLSWGHCAKVATASHCIFT